MTLRHFRIFAAVCDTMNMTTAAEALFISQSAVSQAIAEMEKHYGVRLFERLSRKLYLTRPGRSLLGYARQMIRMNTDIEKNMASLQETGSIRIGASVTVGASVLPGLTAAFKATNPGIALEVFEDNTQQVEKRIAVDQTDIGLVEGEIVSPDVRSIPFMEDELVLICGRNHRFAGCRAVQPHELEKEDFIVREQGSGTRQTFETTMLKHRLSWHASWTCNNADTIKAAVIAGLGVSVISRRAVEREAASGEIVIRPLEGIRFDRMFKIVYHKNKYLSVPMKDFIRLCLRRPSPVGRSPDE